VVDGGGSVMVRRVNSISSCVGVVINTQLVVSCVYLGGEGKMFRIRKS